MNIVGMEVCVSVWRCSSYSLPLRSLYTCHSHVDSTYVIRSDDDDEIATHEYANAQKAFERVRKLFLWSADAP